METKIEQKGSKLRRKKRLWLTVGSMLLLIVCLSAFVNAYINKGLPQLSGEANLPELENPVKVLRDQNGVPHITAKSDRDLYIAQGFIQAQDRLFQMDLSRRQASGTLSEVVGRATIDNDKFFRTLGLRRTAAASYTEYNEESKQVLEWFSDGVNAFISEAKEKGKLPLEFSLLGYEPEVWTPIDSLTIGKYMAFDLGGHWQGQAFRYWALEQFPKDKALDLFPSYPKDASTILPAYENTALDIEKDFATAIIPPEFNGSNNWAVSGNKSETGKPLLADDPHLSLGTPAIWYQMHLQTSEQNVSGVIFAGVPGIILGHNEHIAWGVTNTGPDVQDLYIEKRNPDNPHEFLYNGKWEPALVHDEPIKVKDEDYLDYKVLETRHGPIISEFAHDQKEETALSMQWTALLPSLEFQAILEMNKATNWNEFEEALKDFHVPTQNFVFASEDGTIAFKANGKIPIRKKGDGLIPVPGWSDEYGWEGFIPYSELPSQINPQAGFIATANNKVVDGQYPYHISHQWAQPYRYMRIKEVLEGEGRLSLNDMKNLQMDQKNLYAREFLPAFLKRFNNLELTKTEQKAVSLLIKWNYEDDKDLAAPLIFHLLMKEIPNTLFSDQIPKKINSLFEGKQSIVDDLLRKALAGEESKWISEKGSLDHVLQKSLQKVVNRLTDEYGQNPESWKWGDYHRLIFAHPLSSSSPFLNWIFNSKEPAPIGGSQITVQAAGYSQDGTVDHGASWRFVIDTREMTKGHHIVGPGQAGHFKSRWYDDQLNDWIEGNYHVTDLKKTKGEEVLILSPE
ncbi:penicillin acylase family protein [Metabacillus arenae]|uniref:Penicillin acylase family protein n=1 Tax=Metabacillus arenae TaxID=2771434 RepID=A0A926NDK7_9BACI|nr:penicillin acylase family protein [Metabacillus arenae]MBD1379554.1 penicillin acylase family protein [Metabacillus arenae]